MPKTAKEWAKYFLIIVIITIIGNLLLPFLIVVGVIAIFVGFFILLLKSCV